MLSKLCRSSNLSHRRALICLPRLRCYSNHSHNNHSSHENFSHTHKTLYVSAVATVAAASAALIYHSQRSSQTSQLLADPGSGAAKATAGQAVETTNYRYSIVSERARFLENLSELSRLPLEQLSHLYEFSNDSPVELLYTNNEHSTDFHRKTEKFIRNVQDSITQHLCDLEFTAAQRENLPQVALREDITVRGDGTGGGIARVIQGGRVFSKAGCNISVAKHKLPFKACLSLAEDHKQLQQLINSGIYAENDVVQRYTASISLVFHPKNPFIPTVHANYRYFEFVLPDNRVIYWFGGGTDLTPIYVDQAQGHYFHSKLADLCAQHDNSYYKRFKPWCDTYFRNTLRGESRGIGGIFFDDLHHNPEIKQISGENDKTWPFVRAAAESFSKTYFPLVISQFSAPFLPRHSEFQALRHGRYVEFNLIYDRGTNFGFRQPNARPEAILMSLPLEARWEYKFEAQKGSEEEKTIQILKNPIQWVKEQQLEGTQQSNKQ
jgi:coproporphyrinogen III oxidase